MNSKMNDAFFSFTPVVPSHMYSLHFSPVMDSDRTKEDFAAAMEAANSPRNTARIDQ